MKIFSLIQMQWERFLSAAREGISKSLSEYDTSFNSNTIFGQLINVLGSACQNMMYYIEDSLTEQNKYTAERKRSIYNLASISGYTPSMGKATTAVVRITWKPNNDTYSSIVIPNHTALASTRTGMAYNIILPQESIVCNLQSDNASKYLTVAEGTFETQKFISEGGQLYSKNIKFAGDADIDYLEVQVDNETWERVESIYDMDPNGKQYVARTSLKSGIDLVFGNNQYGKALQDGQVVKATYLIHNGESGNIDYSSNEQFVFINKLKTIDGEEIDGNKIFTIDILDKDYITSGVYSDDIELVREMIGMNSRALVLADAKNYTKLFKKFSFVGYNRVWTEPGSMVVNAIVMRNYKAYLKNGVDYFSLTQDMIPLSRTQKQSIYNSIAMSGEQLAGVVFNIFDPDICKYACYVYVRLKDGDYDEDLLRQQIRGEIGMFFANIQSDIFIPKSDIVHLLKTKIEAIDGVDVYFLSQRNEQALIDRSYEEKTYNYNPATQRYDISTKTIYIEDGENPGIGLDSHGNIYLDNNDQFPVLMGGWRFYNGNTDQIQVSDPLTIIFE